MKFRVEAPDKTLRRMIEHGPQFACFQKHERCAFTQRGPCTAYSCTCEVEGWCLSCVPAAELNHRR